MVLSLSCDSAEAGAGANPAETHSTARMPAILLPEDLLYLTVLDVIGSSFREVPENYLARHLRQAEAEALATAPTARAPAVAGSAWPAAASTMLSIVFTGAPVRSVVFVTAAFVSAARDCFRSDAAPSLMQEAVQK
ncbi:hypothetical protein [Amycolatopsis sp. NPDC059657]|uniref:hypothetical protein n=1 Tax=Amycolatopsis sp. NPDC059657 TaxID=3346899 RepID=UPI00366D4624